MRPTGLTFNADGVAKLGDNLYMLVQSITLGVGESYDLPTDVSGWAELMEGENTEFTRFRWSGTSTITMEQRSSGISSVDEGVGSGYTCVIDAGTNVQILNRNTGSRNINLIAYYRTT